MVIDMRRSLGSSGVTLEVPSGSRETVETRDGHADVHRFFSDGPIVVAAQVRSMAGEPSDLVEDASGELIADYRNRYGFVRRSREVPVVRGALDATLLDFEWQSNSGVLMRSIALIASDGARVAVVHCAVPGIHGPRVISEAESIAASCELVAPGSTS